MKRLLIVAVASLLVVMCAGSLSAKGKDEFQLRVRLTTGERSRDSSSETATITVERKTIVWEKSFGGAGDGCLLCGRSLDCRPQTESVYFN